jgi:hypothetical protein
MSLAGETKAKPKNTKYEARNTKQIQNPNDGMTKRFEHLNF